MFVLNKTLNKLVKVAPKTFSELGFKEREHLQEWIESNPESLDEELLFIQKEFGEFGETRERLDLLAIDKHGNLVVIENKLDDSGRDVTWQVLKYASYCSSLSKPQIKDIYQTYLDKRCSNESGEANIVDFLEKEDWEEVRLNQDQRIILVSGSFRKEVTSTVMWLLNRYNMKIECFKATPYLNSGEVLINIEKIIPVKETEEYTIRMAEKIQEDQSSQNELKERHIIRKEFWQLLIQRYNAVSKLYSNISPTKDAWISAGTGLSGVGFNFVVSKNYARTEVYMSRSNTEENKFIFDRLHAKREDVEREMPTILWERLDNKKASRIKMEKTGVSLYNREDWEEMINFMVINMQEIERVFRPLLVRIKNDLKITGGA